MIRSTKIRWKIFIAVGSVLLLGCSQNQKTDLHSDTEPDTLSSSSETNEVSEVTDWDSENVNIDITWVPLVKGTFTYGSPESFPCRGGYDEKEVEVTLTNSFVMAESEVTQKQWLALGFQLPEPLSTVDDLPISYVNFFDAAMWCNRMSIAEGIDTCYDLSGCTGMAGTGCGEDEKWQDQGCDNTERNFNCAGNIHKFANHYLCPGYRLPTTAEWEYAAKAGTVQHTYNGDVHAVALSYCEAESALDDIAWYCDNANNQPHVVKQLSPNPWGFYDILGNVGEWVDYANQGVPIDVAEQQEGKKLIDPQGPSSGNSYVVKGGFYYYLSGCYIRPSYHVYNHPVHRTTWFGFRPVRTLFGDEAAAVSANPTPDSDSQKDTE